MSPAPKIVQKSMFQKFQRNRKKPTPTVYYRNINLSPAGETCILEISDWLCGKKHILYLPSKDRKPYTQ